MKIPSYFHEVFGEESTPAELVMIFATSIVATVVLFYATLGELSELPVWKTFLLFLLIFDMMAGFIANLTLSTNNFYRNRPSLRLVFIALHIQPLLFSFLLGGHFLICFIVWAYTTSATLIVNALQKYPAQKALAGSLVMFGLVGLQLVSRTLPIVLLVSLAFYQLKVIYSFGVDQYAPREI